MPPRLWLLVDALRTFPRVWLTELSDPAGLRTAFSLGVGLATDLRGAWRSVRRSPGRAALMVTILGLALGANGAIVSVASSVLLGTLPFEDVERLVRVHPAASVDRGELAWVPDEAFLALPDVETAGLYVPDGGANLVDEHGSSRLSVTQVGPGFFPTLGVDAVVGRVIGPERPSSPEVVLSHALWVDGYAADSAIVGRSIDLSGHRFTVVGVLSPGAELPAGMDVWASLPAVLDFYGLAFGPLMIARIRSPDAIPALLAHRRDAVAAAWADVPEHFSRPDVAITPLRNELVGPVGLPLVVLAGAAAAILLLGCLNLAGIELAGVCRRAGELGVRRALGAGRARVFRHLAAEVVLLAAASGVASLVVAWGARRVLVSWLPPGTPGLEAAGSSGPLLLFTAVTTGGAALVVGFLPALRGAATSAAHLSTGGRGERERVRLHHALVVAQVAVAVVLAVGAGVLGRSLSELRSVPLGYDTGSVLTFRVQLPSHAYPDASTQQLYAESVRARLSGLPGVEAVGHASRLPLGGAGLGIGLRAVEPDGVGEIVEATLVEVSPDFFAAMGIRLLAGTSPTPPLVRGEDVGGVVIDRATAQRLFAGPSAVGQTIAFAGRRNEHPGTVAGVAENVRLEGHDGPLRSVIYTSAEGGSLPALSFAVRTREPPRAIVRPLRAAVAEVDPTVPPYDVRTTGDAVREEMAAREALTTLSTLFGVAGVVLVGLGLYGMVAQGVASRRRELGIRLALGAVASRVVGDTVGRALLLVLTGLAIGGPLALAITKTVRSLLFGISGADPVILLAGAAFVLIVALFAALIPASRMASIHPAESLRAQ